MLVSDDLAAQNACIASWFVRRQPLQRLPNCGNKALFVNELFAKDFLLEPLNDKLLKSSVYDREKIIVVAEHLMYTLVARRPGVYELELFLLSVMAAK